MRQGPRYNNFFRSGNAAAAPTQLPLQGNLVARFSADSLALSNGANVTSWTDSINGIVAATAIGVVPTFSTNRVGGKPSVRGLGTGGLQIATPGPLRTAIDSQNYTAYVVYRTLGSTTFGFLFGSSMAGGSGFWLDATGVDVQVFGYGTVSTIPFAGQSAAPFSSYAYTGFAASPWTGGAQPFGAMYVNGCSQTTTSAAPRTSAANPFSILADSGNNFSANAEVFEILVWNTPLTPAQILQTEMWARDKYSQAYLWAGLPSFNVFFGDSQTLGFGATTPDKAVGWLAAQTLGLSLGQWTNPSMGAITPAGMDQLAATWIDPIAALINKKVNLTGFEFFNNKQVSIAASGSQTYLTNRRAIPNVRTVWGTSLSAAADPLVNRAAYNASLDASHPPSLIDSYMPIHTDTHVGVDGSYAAFSGGGDGVHLTDTTQPFLAALFVNGINALP